jgi:hypothetical protein
MRHRFGWLLVVSLMAAAAAALRYDIVRVPDRWNPWAPLAIADEPNLLTRWKLDQLSRDDARCRSVLTQATMRYEPLPDRSAAPGCGWTNAVRIMATTASLAEPLTLTCRTAVSLALWERHVLQPAAIDHFGVRVTRIQHFGSYACRNLYDRDDARRSQHASADALDVSAFVLGDGRIARVLDWRRDDAIGRFLRDAHAGACRFFDAALGPDYNAAHRDHLHLDRGAYRACR